MRFNDTDLYLFKLPSLFPRNMMILPMPKHTTFMASYILWISSDLLTNNSLLYGIRQGQTAILPTSLLFRSNWATPCPPISIPQRIKPQTWEQVSNGSEPWSGNWASRTGTWAQVMMIPAWHSNTPLKYHEILLRWLLNSLKTAWKFMASVWYVNRFWLPIFTNFSRLRNYSMSRVRWLMFCLFSPPILNLSPLDRVTTSINSWPSFPFSAMATLASFLCSFRKFTTSFLLWPTPCYKLSPTHLQPCPQRSTSSMVSAPCRVWASHQTLVAYPIALVRTSRCQTALSSRSSIH